MSWLQDPLGSLWMLAAQSLHFVLHPLQMILVFRNILYTFVAHVTHPWRKLFWLCFDLYSALFGKLILLTMRLLLMPMWIMTTIRREKWLEAQIRQMQMRNKESEQRTRDLIHKLELTIQDRKRVKEFLKQAKNEQKVIIEKYRLLQLHVLKLEEQIVAMKAQENRMSKAFHDGKKSFSQELDVCGALPEGLRLTKSSIHQMERLCFANQAAIHEGKVALSSSMFSISLSLLVGIIIWHSEDPCIPLVLALCMVVCLSLKSVMRLFSSMDNTRGLDAVALLSFNWFILGTVVYPTLPRIAQVVAPTATKIGHWFYGLVGAHYIIEKLKSIFL